MNPFRSLLLAACVLIPLLSVNAVAVTRTASQSGNWSAASTWGGNPSPGPGDDVIINGDFTVTVDAANAASLSVQLGGSTLGTGGGTLLFAAGSQLTVSGAVTVGVTNNTPGSLTMTSGGTLVCEGFTLNRLGVWTQGTGTIVLTATNTIPSDNNVNFNNLTMSGGTTTLSRNITVSGNILINPGATLNGGANILTFSGNWTNNGTFTGSTGTVTFAKNGNQSIAGTGVNDFNLIRVDMGAAIANTLEVTSSNFNAPDGFLTLTNGTFKLSGSFSFSNTLLVGPIYNIQPTSGLWINNPNVTVTPQAGGISVRGLLRLSAGTYNIGTSVDNSLDYVAGSAIIIDGGALNIAGRLSRNSPASTTSYTQTGGTVTVAIQGSTSVSFGAFDLGMAGSSFTMSGGSIVVRNATSNASDFVDLAATASVTGGTLQIGDALSQNGQIVRIQSARPVGNLLVSNATASPAKPTAQLVTSGLTVAGSITIQSGTTLNANGLNVALGGDWVDGGAFTAGGNTVTFNGSGAQSLTKPGSESFNALTINKPGGTLLLNNSVTVDNAFSLTQGTLAVGLNTLSLNGAVTGGGVLTSGAAGTVAYGQASAGQSVLAGSYGNLVFSDFGKILASAGTIGIAGTFTPGAAAGHATTGSTIDYNGGSQAVPPFAYFHLAMSGSGTKSAGGAIDVAGNLTNGAGSVFTGSTALTLHGATHANAGSISAASLDVGTGAVLANSGTMTIAALVGGLGTLTQSASGTLNIAGAVSVATLNASAAGNTVNYTGTSQTVAPVIYHHLTLSGSGSPVLAGLSEIHGNFALSGAVTAVASSGMTIGGNCSIGSGTSFSAGSFSHVVKGNWVTGGAFSAGTGSVTMAGSGAQTAGGSAFNDLIIDNAAGVSMSGDNSISGALTLTSGIMSIGAHTLTLGGALSVGGGSLAGTSGSNLAVPGSGSALALPGMTLNNLTLSRDSGASLLGDVTVFGALAVTNGTLNTGAHAVILGPGATMSELAGKPVVGTISTTRTIAATTGTFAFGNIGAEVTLHGTALGATTIVRKTGSASAGSGHASIQRFFDITPAVNAGLNAGLVFHYDHTELSGQNAAALELYRSQDNGATWTNFGGAVDTALRTMTATGINGFSRWTLSDTANRIGLSPVPTTTGIAPASKKIGEPGFILAVNGANFVEGRSVVRYNGADRPTSFVSGVQLTAAIPASDLSATASVPVTVFNAGGGGSSNAQTFTVLPLPPTSVRVESAADGSGSIVPSQAFVSGLTMTMFAIARDSLNNFVSNISASTWALENITGGIAPGDLVAAPDGKSAVFTARAIGSADVKAAAGLLTATPSGTITVLHGAAARIGVETAANGTGTLVPAQSVVSGSHVTVFAVKRDASNNFVSNDSASSWSLANLSGGVVAGDLAPAIDGRSAVFTGHVTGAANVSLASGALPATPSGLLTVTPGAAAAVDVETAGNGSGDAVPAQSLSSGSSLTVFSIARDASGNFVSNIPADLWTLQNITGSVVAADLVPSPDGKKAVFTGHGLGSANIRAVSGALAVASSGAITVVLGTVAVSVPVASGWNLVSNPVLNPVPGDSVKQMYPASVNPYAFEFNAGYAQSFRLANGKGYWAKFGAGGTATIGGSSDFADTVAVTAGWNLVGSISVPLPASLISSIPAGIVTNNFFGYAAGYAVADTLLPGKGYWVKVTQSGSLVLSAFPGASASNAIRIMPTSEAPPPPPEERLAASALIPAAHVLDQNYPNPFNPSTTITFGLPSRSRVKLEVYNTMGQQIALLLDGELEAGYHRASWNASGVASGLYLYRIEAVDADAPTNSFVQIKKMLLVR